MSSQTDLGDITAVELFCGPGGASTGIQDAGINLVTGVDKRAIALETHETNYPDINHIHHDLTDVDPEVLPVSPGEIDYVHGSPPCPGFSVGGMSPRDLSDERNKLVWKFVQWVDHLQPKVITMENVKGMTTITDHFMERLCGTGFPGGQQATLTGDIAHTQEATEGFSSINYKTRWRVLNAADFGVPQTRERLFVVGIREDIDPPDRWFPEPTHNQSEWRTVRDALGDVASDMKPGMWLTSSQNERHQIMGRRPMPTVEQPAATLRGGTTPLLLPEGVDGEKALDVGRRLTVREVALLQTFPENYEFCGTKTEKLEQIGDAVPPQLQKHVAKTACEIIAAE